jgi:DNA primase
VAQRYIDFAYVKENASFEQVIACYNLKLVGTGSQRSVLCPFHRERKASCKIDLERNIWHCFGCEAKGNVLEFVARMEGDPDDLRAAAMKITEICGIATAPPREPAGQRPAGEHRRKGARSKNTSTRRPRVAKAWVERAEGGSAQVGLTKPDFDGAAEPVNLPLTFALKLEPRHPYLKERGLSPEIVAEFGLGYCNRGLMGGASAFRSITSAASLWRTPAVGPAKPCRTGKNAISCRRSSRRAGCSSICTASPPASTLCSSKATGRCSVCTRSASRPQR